MYRRVKEFFSKSCGDVTVLECTGQSVTISKFDLNRFRKKSELEGKKWEGENIGVGVVFKDKSNPSNEFIVPEFAIYGGALNGVVLTRQAEGAGQLMSGCHAQGNFRFGKGQRRQGISSLKWLTA